MIKIYIDDKPVETGEGTTIFQSARQAGIHIPHLCYHPAFPPEGTCRICLVEIEGIPKLELACSTQVRDGMKISTKSEKVIEARKGVLEFLLADHPLDCPICDQAGDCKLQDYYEEYGLSDNRYDETKERRAKKIEIGKNLIHDQERCVLCRRCVRFLREVTHTSEMGVFERGIHTEVDILEGKPVDNNYSGNLAQLCPVGAITDTDFRFKTRNWFLKKGESICPQCSRGCSISIESISAFHRFPVPKRVYRITARENKSVNGNWICDIGRYSYAYLDQSRLDDYIVNNNSRNEDKEGENPLTILAKKIKEFRTWKKTSKIALLLSSWLTNEELYLLKKIFADDLGAEKIYFIDLPEKEGDDLLLTGDRNPNTRGAREIGFDVKPFDPQDLSDSQDMLLAFIPFTTDPHPLMESKAVLEKVEMKFLFSPYSGEQSDLFDIVIPTRLIAEKEGSLINVDGTIQSFNPALEGPGASLPEWEILVSLAREIGLNVDFYKKLSSLNSVRLEMIREIPSVEIKK
jgi:NADH-quinone oxidoreductase subunit G